MIEIGKLYFIASNTEKSVHTSIHTSPVWPKKSTKDKPVGYLSYDEIFFLFSFEEISKDSTYWLHILTMNFEGWIRHGPNDFESLKMVE